MLPMLLLLFLASRLSFILLISLKRERPGFSLTSSKFYSFFEETLSIEIAKISSIVCFIALSVAETQSLTFSAMLKY